MKEFEYLELSEDAKEKFINLKISDLDSPITDKTTQNYIEGIIFGLIGFDNQELRKLRNSVVRLFNEDQRVERDEHGRSSYIFNKRMQIIVSVIDYQLLKKDL